MFKPYQERGELQRYATTLPHWRQEGCTYFVTYRLADSIPLGVLAQWEKDKREWLLRFGHDAEDWRDSYGKLDAVQQWEFLKVFNRRLNSYLDKGHGSCELQRTGSQQVVRDTWLYFNGQKYELGDLVVMPNHVHVLLTPKEGNLLEDILQSRKRQSAREINLLAGKQGALWQKHSYDHIVRDETELAAFKKYISENPVKAGLREGEYLHWVPQ